MRDANIDDTYCSISTSHITIIMIAPDSLTVCHLWNSSEVVGKTFPLCISGYLRWTNKPKSLLQLFNALTILVHFLSWIPLIWLHDCESWADLTVEVQPLVSSVGNSGTTCNPSCWSARERPIPAADPQERGCTSDLWFSHVHTNQSIGLLALQWDEYFF